MIDPGFNERLTYVFVSRNVSQFYFTQRRQVLLSSRVLLYSLRFFASLRENDFQTEALSNSAMDFYSTKIIYKE